MTDPDNKGNEVSEEQTSESKPSLFDSEGDWLLVHVVNIAEGGIRFPVTLLVGGFLVSGTIIDGKSYLARLDEQFRGALNAMRDPSDEEYGSDVGLVGVFRKVYDVPREEALFAARRFVHLEDARYYTSTGQPMLGPHRTLWRGDLTSVGGWFLGRIEQEQ